MNRFKPSYFGQYLPIEMTSYKEHRFDQFAVVFPGQGSLPSELNSNQLKKMRALKKYLNIIDHYLDGKIMSKSLWYLTQPQSIDKAEFPTIQNLFLFALNVASFELLIENRIPSLVTAHSFGEYAALVCLGVMSFEDILPIVFQREKLSPDRNSLGTLIAANIDINLARNISKELNIQIANINSNDQIVFAVSIDQLSEMKRQFKTKKIAYRVLEQVGRPYHSQMMSDCSNQLKQFIVGQDFQMSPLKFDFISSVTGKMYPSGYLFSRQEIISILTLQLINQVDFVSQVLKIIDRQIFGFIDLSFSGVMKSLIQQLTQNKMQQFVIRKISELSFFDNSKQTDALFHVDLEKNPLFKVITKYIAQVTGYEVVEIGINDYFQEDLRIDSIKKAEIVFKTLQETQLNIEESLTLAQLKRVGDVVKYLQHRKENPTLNKLNYKYEQDDFRAYKLQAGKINYQNSIRINWNNQPIHKCILFSNMEQKTVQILLKRFWSENLANYKQLIIDLSDLNDSMNISSLFNILEYWVQIIQNNFPEVDSQHFQVLLTCFSRKSTSFEFPFVQFFKSVAIEYGFRFQWIEDTKNHIDLEKIELYYFDEVNDHIMTSNHDLFRNNFEVIPDYIAPSEKNDLQVSHALIIGGAKGLAFELLNQLNILSDSELTIVGRSDSNHAVVKKNIALLGKKYRKVNYFQCDCTEQIHFEKLIQISHVQPFQLVIHAAGIEKSEKLINKNITQIQNELKSKMIISDLLIRHFHGIPQIHFSSIVGFTGNDGQSIYSFANAWQIDLNRRFQNPNVKVICWPAVDHVGMTANQGIYHKMKANGVQFLNLNQAVLFFQQSLKDLMINQNSETILIAHQKDLALLKYQLIDWKKWSQINGQLVDPERLIYQFNFNLLNYNYLQDHRFEAMTVLPASAIVAQLLIYGIRHCLHDVSILDFTIHNMLMVLANQDVIAQAQYYHHFVESKAVIDYRLMTQLEHFTARIVDSRNAITEINQQHFSEVQFNQLEVDLSTFYSPECIDFGLKFQVFENLYYHHNQHNDLTFAVGRLKKQEIYYSGDRLNDLYMMIIENAFQTASMLGVVEGKRLGIPLSLKKIELFDALICDIFCVATTVEKINPQQQDEMIFDIEVFNSNKQILMKIHHLVLSPIRLHPNLPFRWLEKNHHYEL